jgi:hypothetical protein
VPLSPPGALIAAVTVSSFFPGEHWFNPYELRPQNLRSS